MRASGKETPNVRVARQAAVGGAARALLLCGLGVACGDQSSAVTASSDAQSSMAPTQTSTPQSSTTDSGVNDGKSNTHTDTRASSAAGHTTTGSSGTSGTSQTASSTPQAGTTAAAGVGPAGSAGTAMPTAGTGTAAAMGTAGTNAAAAGTTDMTAEPAPACPATSSLRAGDNRKTLSHGERDRRFNVYVPASLPAMTRVPLVLDFHGNGSSGMQEQSGSGWRQKADTENFIVVYPDGVGNGWNVGNCCGEALNSMVDDVGFARAMVETVSEEACIDSHRVYATGISNGAGLAHRLACEAADIFAAIAAASADLVTDPCEPARPISEISVRGLTDTLVNYDGGNTGSTGWYSPGAKGTLALWKDIDGCQGEATTSMQYCESYTACNAGVEVTLCSLPGTGHILYTNSVGFSVPDTAWEMFKRQTLP